MKSSMWIGLLSLASIVPGAAALADPPNLNWSAPLVIRSGGTYTGNFRSTDHSTPAILVDTPDAVIIENCNLTGSGELIKAWNSPNLIVRNCNGYGVTPPAGASERGRFITASGARRIWLENNYFEKTRGIIVANISGATGFSPPVKIVRNVMKNAESRIADGSGGQWSSHLQLLNLFNVPNVEVAWNQTYNEPGESSVGDNLNFYKAQGTSSSPIQVHDNFVQGAYPSNPTDGFFTGTGMTTDGDSNDAEVPAYLEAHHNQFVSTCNAAMNLVSGHNIRFYENRMITAGVLPDGRVLNGTYAATSTANYYNNPIMHDNSVDHNVIGYVKPGYNIPYPNRHDLSSGACADCHDNTHLPNPITLDTEKNEWTLWNQKLVQNNVQVGSTAHSNNGRISVGNGSNPYWGGANGGGVSTPTPTPTPTATPVVTPTATPSAPASTGTIVSTGSAQCMSVAGDSLASGARWVPSSCNGSTAQKFSVVAFNSTQWQIKSQLSGKCMDVENASTADGALIQQWDCGSGLNQLFTIPASTGGQAIVSVKSGKCVAISGASLVQTTCTQGVNQLWLLNGAAAPSPSPSASPSPSPSPSPIPSPTLAPPPALSGVKNVQGEGSGKCLDVANASPANGALIQQYSCGLGANQRFELRSASGGYYTLVVQRSGKCLDVSNASTGNGAAVQQYDCWGGDNQLVSLAAQSNGNYVIRFKHSNKCLDVSNASTANGALTQQWDCNGQPNQRWKFTN